MKRVLFAGAVLVLLGAALGIGLVFSTARAPLPDHNRNYSLAGLHAPVDIVRDRWGVPHIYAQSVHDLVFAQGFVHAQDRWWTMAFYRALARGELSGLIGRDEDALQNDVLMRSLDLAGRAERDFAELDKETRSLIQAFSDGINAYLKTRSSKTLAAEYALLELGGLEPKLEPWRPEDSLAVGKLMGFSLSGRDIAREITRAAVASRVTPEMYRQWFAPYDYERHPTVIRKEDLPAVGASAVPGRPPVDDTRRKGGSIPKVLQNAYLRRLPGQAASHGSNAWVVSGEHTKSGMPLLAVDSHLGIEIPNVWHEIGFHLRPEDSEPFDIYGMAAAPFFLILEGNNTFAAWGTTNITGGDSLDLYELKIDPQNSDRYFWDGAWREMDVREIAVSVAGEDKPVRARVRRTHFGPVLPRAAEEKGPVYAIRWGGFTPSAIARASARIPFVRTFEGLREALRDWDYPPTNFLFAGRNGQIGYQAAGRFPVRAEGSDGTRPQRGWTSEDAWQGFLPFELMPHVNNPATGMIVSGNNPSVLPLWFDRVRENLGGGDPDFLKDAARGFRAARIEERLNAERPHSVESFAAIQTDVTTFGLKDSMPIFASVRVAPEAYDCRNILARWSGTFDRESAGALIFAHLWNRILEEVYHPHLGPDVRLGVGMNELMSLQLILEDPSSGWWDHPDTSQREDRDERLPGLVDATCQDLRDRYGNDASGWRWGDIHRAHFKHPIFGASGLPLIEDWANAGPVIVDGGVGTVSVGRWNADSDVFDARHIPSYRRIIDLADMESSRAVNSVGQSSHPGSPHYADQVGIWAKGQYRTPGWTDAQVEAAASARQRLNPLR